MWNLASFPADSCTSFSQNRDSIGGGLRQIYLSEPNDANHIGLYRSGTRVLERISEIDAFARFPWDTGYLAGILDAPFVNLNPGTRQGLVRDDAFAELCRSLSPLEKHLGDIVEKQKKAEEDRTNQQTLRSIQKAFREGDLAFPWMTTTGSMCHGRKTFCRSTTGPQRHGFRGRFAGDDATGGCAIEPVRVRQKEFFEHAGPLHSVRVSPSTCVVQIGKERQLTAIARDQSRRAIEADVEFSWSLVEGAGDAQRSQNRNHNLRHRRTAIDSHSSCRISR